MEKNIHKIYWTEKGKVKSFKCQTLNILIAGLSALRERQVAGEDISLIASATDSGEAFDTSPAKFSPPKPIVDRAAANALIAKLDKFPHIQAELDMFWGKKEGRDFLTSLTVSNRPNRAGFPFEAVIAIDDLIDLHDLEYPKFKPLPESAWDPVRPKSV
jgi:hypothetical protein